MPNTYFQFKQFTVQQEKAALKVSTDSCLFGAWIAEEVGSRKYNVRNVLDIGTGTGLLMLMIAQKCNAVIDGIEIDEPSYEQAKENAEASAWQERLNLFCADVKQYRFEKKYDLIISNPPFYENNLKSEISNINVAKHDEGLKLDDLLQIIDDNLTADGRFAVLLPYHRSESFTANANKKGFYLQLEIKVKQSVNHSFFRSMLLLGRDQSEAITNELSIKDENNLYTNEFVELLKDYYLYL
jgi:tRNA1Val (adenine37-N6)-methyltransferase